MTSKLLPWLLVVPILAVVAIGFHAFASVTPAQSLANYHNDQWHFSINVPADMTVDDNHTQGDEQIIQFSDAAGDRIFEISATPYAEIDVALGEEGAPNTTTDQSTNLGIVNVYHNDTFIVAFHRNGIAYTITALPDAEPWLLPILQSWEFTE